MARLGQNLGVVQLAGALPLLLLLAGCGRSAAEVAPQPPLVKLATVATAGGDIDRYTGVVAPRVESALSFRVGGKITARLVEAGQVVRAGQVLARLDGTDFALGAASAVAQSAASRGQAAAASRQVAAAEAGGLAQPAGRAAATRPCCRKASYPSSVMRKAWREPMLPPRNWPQPAPRPTRPARKPPPFARWKDRPRTRRPMARWLPMPTA
jgi:hypothetical protein